MTDRQEGLPASSDAIEIGGEVRRIVILTVRREPCACYLARRLRSSGAEIFLVSQRGLKVEPGSFRYYRRLYERRGALVTVDNLLLHLLKAVARLPRALLRAGAPRPAPANGTRVSDSALRDDPGIVEEDWLTYLEVDNINKSPDRDRLRELRPDLILLAGAPILFRKTIEIASVACINPHCGIVPDYAGSSPFNWAIYERRFRDVGFTLHQVVPKVDGGPVMYQERVEWDPSRVNGHLWPILAQRMYDKLADVTQELIRGRRFAATPQENVRVMPPAGLFVRTIAELRRVRHAAASGRLGGRSKS